MGLTKKMRMNLRKKVSVKERELLIKLALTELLNYRPFKIK